MDRLLPEVQFALHQAPADQLAAAKRAAFQAAAFALGPEADCSVQLSLNAGPWWAPGRSSVHMHAPPTVEPSCMNVSDKNDCRVSRRRRSSDMLYRKVFKEACKAFGACGVRDRALTLQLNLLARNPGQKSAVRAAFNEAYPS
ncbi:MAG: hypothetical protein OEY44_03685 [Candidatus Peregrinibacteria bacterium]|nr:hypothetical protein [Candidatus Peregrinibacteria bacterium]